MTCENCEKCKEQKKKTIDSIISEGFSLQEAELIYNRKYNGRKNKT
jgi:hypothetical protein